MPRLVEVRAVEPYRIHLRYDDGVRGEVDLSDLAGEGVFGAWQDRKFFESVKVGEFGEASWGEEIDLDPYALYMRLTGKSADEVFPDLGQARSF